MTLRDLLVVEKSRVFGGDISRKVEIDGKEEIDGKVEIVWFGDISRKVKVIGEGIFLEEKFPEKSKLFGKVEICGKVEIYGKEEIDGSEIFLVRRSF